MPLLASAGLFALCVTGVLAAMLAWANPVSAQTEPLPRLIITPTELHVGEGDSATYTVHFDRNPSAFDNVECGDANTLGKVYVNMRGFDSSELSVEPFTPEFRTGNANCEGGNWDSPRTIWVAPVDENVDMGRRTVTIAHAVWDNGGGTPVEEDDAPKVRVTIYDDDPSGPLVAIASPPSAFVTEFSNVTFMLTRACATGCDNWGITQPLTVTVNLSETGNMLSGPRSRSVEFAAGSETADLTVDLDDDNVDEDASVITATIRGPSGYAISGRPWATTTVSDNDTALLGVSANPESIEEGQRSTVTVSITNGVTFGENQVIELDVTSTTAADTDYTVRPESLTFRAGQSQATAIITAVDDADYEQAEEIIEVSVSRGGRTFGPATITIQPSDLDAPQPAWSANLTVAQGTANSVTFLGFSGSTGMLDPTTFNVGTDSYTVNNLTLEDPFGSNPTLAFRTTSNLTTDFVLDLGGRQYRPSDATGTLSSYDWASPGLSWSDGNTVAVKLDVFDPMLSRTRMTELEATTAKAIVETTNANGSTVHLQYRSQDASVWDSPSPPNVAILPGMTEAGFSLTSLTEGTVYEVRASLDSAFNTGVVETTFTAGTPPPPPPPPRPSPPPQDQPGTVTLSSGQPQVGMELAATLTDADEGIADVIWLWERSTDQDSWSAISGAESASYTPVDAGVGHYLRATASYTDVHGPGKSAAAVTAGAVIAGDPLIARYDVNKNGVIEKREVIRAISDYFSGVEGLTKADVIRLISIYFDGGGGPGTTDPPGEVTLSSGQPQVGTELAATLTDADEGIADVTWLWERSTEQDTWSVISGAESASYTPVDADVGHYLRATASYTDVHGPGKSAAAVTAGAVIARDPLIARYDVNKNGVIEKREVIRAISDYFSGVEGLTKADVIRLISIYFDG